MDSLNHHPLWRFALDVYPRAQSSLLHWQDSYGIHVNDLLLLAFARDRDQGLDLGRWYRIETGRPRALLRRVRRLRYRLNRDDPRRDAALRWELQLEQIDLALLAECLDENGTDMPRSAARLARHWRLDEQQTVVDWVRSIG
ncbi:DUF2390 domain-containing protein [Saccharospirillum salsuginis]|uniref:TIGR02444 family protein n=1 Tax=Saccharospirillum salsuginis TaxID=418750 RepID=A0A918K5D4_9GAMM|nr:DUF2390 domain-containing protein [Saccharospirillum salsuginis]GGX47377.1 hypothetical protein GCM10007392_12770 [Saccharospirillum salsuginis]